MGLMDKAKQAAEQAKTAASQAAQQARSGAAANASAGQDIKSQLAQATKWGKSSLSTLVERIDPGILADLIIKATAAQEKANASLKGKGSVYRISEITITATIPPQIGFAVSRIGDVEEVLTGRESESAELLAEGVTDVNEAVVSLAGDDSLADIIAEESRQ